MSTRTGITATTSGLALAALVLTGCVAVDNGPQPGSPSSSPATSAPTGETSRSPWGSARDETPEPSGSPSPKREIVDLTPDRGTVYIVANRSAGMLAPPKVFGPWLTYWHIDGDRITYREIVCTGRAVTEAKGRVGDKQVLWDDVDPWIGDAEAQSTSMKKTDATIRVGFTGVATSDVASEKEKFVGLCKDAGEKIADFVLK